MDPTRCIGFVVGLVVAIAVYSDAVKLKEQGAKVTPALWAIVIFLFLLIAQPTYLILRTTTWRKQIDLAKGLTPGPMTAGQTALVVVLSAVLLLGAPRHACADGMALGIVGLIVFLWRMSPAEEQGNSDTSSPTSPSPASATRTLSPRYPPASKKRVNNCGRSTLNNVGESFSVARLQIDRPLPRHRARARTRA
jgi:hypothetical protein